MYSKAVEQGYAGAQNDLGYCYANGVGVEVDIEKKPCDSIDFQQNKAAITHNLILLNFTNMEEV